MKLQRLHKISRREAMMLISGIAGSAIFPSLSFSQTNQALKRIDEITKGLGAEESDIYLDLPEIAENGNQVKVSFEMDSPMTQSDYIKAVYILSDGNPSPNVAKFSFTPEMGSCSATTRMRLSKTQNVYLLAESNSGQFLMTNAKVKVTIGGCGG
jgi:sulfur-oxidizing protein SoxY